MIGILSTTHGEGHGAETVLQNLLTGWENPERDFVIVTPPSSRIADVASREGIPWVPLDTARDSLRLNLPAALKIRRALSGCSRVHAWHGRGFELAWMLARTLGVPATGTQHDHPHAGFYGSARQRLMKCSANRYQRLACVSHAVAEACRQAGYRCPLEVVYNGADPVVVTPTPREQLHIGFLGMYAEWKGFSIVEQWVRELVDLPVQWNLFGNSGARAGERARDLRRDCPGRVEIRGWKPIGEVLGSIDILVAPSSGFEPFGMVVVEAAGSRIPSVVSSAGGLKEVVQNGETGFVFDPRRPGEGLARVRQLVTDAALRTRLGEQAFQDARARFSTGTMVGNYQAFWERVSGSSVPARPNAGN